MQDGAVLKDEVLSLLNIKKDGIYVDATAGEGFFAEEILLNLNERGKLLLVDVDEMACMELTKKKIFQKPNVFVRNASYLQIPEILKKENFGKCNGILFDFGIGTYQLKSKRGFSFSDETCLDMRYSTKTKLTARDVVNNFSQDLLIKILKEFGEEFKAKKIVRAIISHRHKKPIESAKELADIISRVIPGTKRHPATKTFQALRIFVNRELENIENVFSFLSEILEHCGRAVFLSYHSLEDRIVKNKLKALLKTGEFKNLTKKPIKATRTQALLNPRARSIRIRAVEKI
ncbi:MAG: 16S rRNA (cytosine(1402)-N(4))-methyltransferase RsmH [Elusimicrobia bacterium]|nr:16S rRNA (cytosine(1402)-N(4))-methyltransferase RsmH [Elusimicrobiota bacterium]